MNKQIVTLDVQPYFESFTDNAWSINALTNNEQEGYWEPFFYLCIRKSLESFGYNITVKKLEDIDKNKPWFINLKVLGHNWDREKSIFADFPQEWLTELIHGNAYLIVNQEDEYWTENLLRLFYKHYRSNPIIPINKIVIISGASLIHDVHIDYCKKHNITEKVKIIFSPHMNVLFNE